MNIKYWSDYACPYCYIGKTNMKKALDDLGIDTDLLMLAFELNPEAPKEDSTSTVKRFEEKYRVSEEEAQKMIDNVNRMAKEAGLDFDYNNIQATNTFDAHRLTRYAQSVSEELADQLSQRLFEGYYLKGENIADHAVLTSIAEELEMDMDAVKKVLESDEFSKDVRMDEIVAQHAQVNGVPVFIINDYYAIQGALPVEEFTEHLKYIQEASDGEGAPAQK